MSGYNYADIVKMQNDAMRRVNEMNENAQRIVAQADSELQPPSAAVTYGTQRYDKPRHVPMPDDYIRDLKDYAKKSKYPPDTSGKPNDSLRKMISNLSSGNMDLPQYFKNALSDLNIDNDRALLLSLVLLLCEERKDDFLIIALLYMMI